MPGPDEFAGEMFQRAVDSADVRMQALQDFERAAMLAKQGDLPAARTAYEQAIGSQVLPFAQMAGYHLGCLLEQQGDTAGARWAYEGAVAFGDRTDGGAKALYQLGFLLQEDYKDAAGARHMYERAARSGHPDVAPAAEFALGTLLGIEGDPAGARNAYQRAIKSGHPVHAPRAGRALRILLDAWGQREFQAVHGPQARGREAKAARNPDLRKRRKRLTLGGVALLAMAATVIVWTVNTRNPQSGPTATAPQRTVVTPSPESSPTEPDVIFYRLGETAIMRGIISVRVFDFRISSRPVRTSTRDDYAASAAVELCQVTGGALNVTVSNWSLILADGTRVAVEYHEGLLSGGFKGKGDCFTDQAPFVISVPSGAPRPAVVGLRLYTPLP